VLEGHAARTDAAEHEGPAVIALIDYGAGNLTSVRKGLLAAGAAIFTPAAAAELGHASAIVVPGVGHFNATAGLTEEWRSAIQQLVRSGIPLLGICLGLQWLFEGSEEAPGVPGFGTLAGRCARLPPGRKVPHVGWNVVNVRTSRLLRGIPDRTYAYFTHSYAAPVTEACVAVAEYGMSFAAAVESENVFGVQFHPEKSGPAGIQILRNFVAVSRTS
jgi:glutamine amidotransferase